jgi:hypothetical protein
MSGPADLLCACAEEADFVIQATQVSSQPPTGANGGMMDDLLQLTGRFLRSPGLQREIVKVMMEDKQVGWGHGHTVSLYFSLEKMKCTATIE